MKKERVKYIISILSWDTPEYIDNLLFSLESFVPSKEFYKIIVLDQGSEEATKKILENHSESFIQLNEDENIGFSKGHNKVFKYADEKYDFEFFSCLNSDMIVMESMWLNKLSNPFSENEKMGITGPFALNLNWQGIGEEAGNSDDFDIISGAMFLTSYKNIIKYGFFDEVFTPAYYEDTDLNMRYKKAGLSLKRIAIECDHHYFYTKLKTAAIKDYELRDKFGNFRRRNSQIILKRWVSRGFLRKGIINRIIGFQKYSSFYFKQFIISIKRCLKSVMYSDIKSPIVIKD